MPCFSAGPLPPSLSCRSHSFSKPPPHLSLSLFLCLSLSLCVSVWTAAQFHTQGKMKHSNHRACCQIKGCEKLFEGQRVCVCLCVCACVCMCWVCVCLPVYMCVRLGCEIWVCLCRVFFPSVLVQPECSVCERIVPLGVSVYPTLENKSLQESKGRGGAVTYLPSLQNGGERSTTFYIHICLPKPAEQM